MFAYLVSKEFWRKVVLAIIISFYQPVEHLLLPLVWLVFIDIISGMYVAKIIEHKDLTSRGFLQKLTPVGLFLVALSASLHANLFFVEFGLPQYQAAKFVMSFYGLYELFSILENLGKSGLPVAKQLAGLLKAKLPQEVSQATTESQPPQA